MYYEFLTGLLAAFVLVTVYSNVFASKSASTTQASFPQLRAFRYQFVGLYLLMMAADWMQGPYVYKLYSFYGFSRTDNGILFIAGFGSSLIFGTWAGPMADKYGRKLNCIMYGVAYALSCATKHSRDFGVLMVGRLLGGFATSILWSAFESWMVSEHNSRGFPPEEISQTFSMMITGNGLVAIVSGFVAQWAFTFFEHPVAPFDVSAILLVLGTLFISLFWRENYGSTTSTSSVGLQLREAWGLIFQDRRITLAGLQQAAFEGAMYTFVFMWTPSLPENIPHGIIFSCFMISCSLGSTLFGYFASNKYSMTSILKAVFLGAAAAMSIPIFTTEPWLIFTGFIVFEVLVGLFWPAIGTLRSQYIPESHRASIINLFRVPLNAVVCIVLYFQGSMSVSMVFCSCVVFHLFAAWMAFLLHSLPPLVPAGESNAAH